MAVPTAISTLLTELEIDRQSFDGSATAHWNRSSRHLSPLRDWLAERFFHKCVYCESYFRHVGFNNIEHFLPKQYFPQWTYEMPNLLLACQICNSNKRESIGDAIHPIYGVPENHLAFVSEVVEGITAEGEACRDCLQLNRRPLREARLSYLTDLRTYLMLARKYPETAEVVATFLAASSSESGVWSAAARSFLQGVVLPGTPIDPLPTYAEARQLLTEATLAASQQD